MVILFVLPRRQFFWSRICVISTPNDCIYLERLNSIFDRAYGLFVFSTSQNNLSFNCLYKFIWHDHSLSYHFNSPFHSSRSAELEWFDLLHTFCSTSQNSFHLDCLYQAIYHDQHLRKDLNSRLQGSIFGELVRFDLLPTFPSTSQNSRIYHIYHASGTNFAQ